MRHQGRITDWKDDRGFGFITPNGGGAKVFVHFRAVRKGEPRPVGDELVTYELEPAGAKGPRAADVAYVDRAGAIPRHRADEPRGGGGLSLWIGAVLLIAVAAFSWQKYSVNRAMREYGSLPREVSSMPATPIQELSGVPATPKPAPLVEQVVPGTSSTQFKCEGKTRCSQMSSCEEATYYLRNCPGVKIDGDGDGIPCEDALCKPRR